MKNGNKKQRIPNSDPTEKCIRSVVIPGIALSLDDDPQLAISEAKRELRRAGITAEADYSIYKRSVDARVRGGVRTVRFVYSVLAAFSSDLTVSSAV